MTSELLALIAAHFACSDMASERYLSPGEIQYCSAIYQEIKLSFVPGVDLETYFQLSAPEQSAVNKEGFTAFYTWRLENPEIVQHLERVARGEELLAEGMDA